MAVQPLIVIIIIISSSSSSSIMIFFMATKESNSEWWESHLTWPWHTYIIGDGGQLQKVVPPELSAVLYKTH